jgi:CDP-diacylglycerol--glycerol-3-phosphate 3-phosphatidyltransferase
MPAMSAEQLRDRAKHGIQMLQRPFLRAALRAGINADTMSWIGLALSLAAGGLVLAHAQVWAGIVLLLAGGADVLDGTLARTQGNGSRFGAFLDSTLDRVGEGAVLAAVVVSLAQAGQPWAAGLAALAGLFGQLVSYTRARAEGLGVACAVGTMTRGERMVVLVAGLITGWLVPALALIAGLSALTSVQRARTVARALKAEA